MIAPVEMWWEAPLRDLGGLFVRRALPNVKRRHVGPFVFVDQMGPAELPPGEGVVVRPHPHIGLATVTWLYAGRIRHRDSLGYVQDIEPGDVNWMHAGRGIVHSERSTPEDLAAGSRISGIQSWVALPRDQEESEPWFQHHPKAELPVVDVGGTRVTVIAGHALGARSPVRTASAMLYLDVPLRAGRTIDLPREHVEAAIYVASGRVSVGEHVFGAGAIALFGEGDLRIAALEDARLMVLGGDPFPEPRFIDWNFVATSRERIDRAKQDWIDRKFPDVPGETEFIPLPDVLKPHG
jgi:redox-sensitive bicupin YhaK (pirin superfamily)